MTLGLTIIQTATSPWDYVRSHVYWTSKFILERTSNGSNVLGWKTEKSPD